MIEGNRIRAVRKEANGQWQEQHNAKTYAQCLEERKQVFSSEHAHAN